MLKGGWGRIVNISGISNHLPNFSGRAHISTAKAGLEGLTRALANEYAKCNITVNCVSPGAIGGERSKTSGEAAQMEVPIGRMGAFEDIARVAFRHGIELITGQVLHIMAGSI
jgi:3-oxoacyl-[acyl-carrier protein] reductase